VPPRLTGLRVGGAPEPWAAFGFAPVDDGIEVGEVRLSFAPEAPPGLAGWSWDAVGASELDGVPTAQAPPAGAPEHPNGITGVDHVVLATPDLERTRRALDAAGLDFRRERETPQVRQLFYVAGPLLVEVAGPAGAPDGDGPARLWGITFVAADLERFGTPKDAVQPGRRIVTVPRAAGLGVPVAVMTPRVRS
jgi:catechol 2,3-dioxygenase-like lactoylglutathione lyase family enzyme